LLWSFTLTTMFIVRGIILWLPRNSYSIYVEVSVSDDGHDSEDTSPECTSNTVDTIPLPSTVPDPKKKSSLMDLHSSTTAESLPKETTMNIVVHFIYGKHQFPK